MLTLSSCGRLSLLHNALLLVVASFALLGGAFGLHQQTKRAPADATRQAPTPAPAPAKSEPAREADNIERPTSEPYAGSLSIFEDPKRDEKLQIERVMDALKLKEGASVADIGAGSGWFTVRAARRVGNNGSVYAVEINEAYLKHISDRAAKENLPNIRTVRGLEDDPLLPANSVDAILLLKTYHEIAQPIRLLRNARRALRAGALLGVIDRNGGGDDHGLDRDKVVREAERAGFALAEEYNHLVKGDGMDYFLVFRAK
ncbi:MAG: class I SAM-dependent methyltransferase [Pyrinomonadaceae bacterium]